MAMLVDRIGLQSWHSEQPVQSCQAKPCAELAQFVTLSSNHGRPAIAVRSVQGRRLKQEDSFSVVTDLLGVHVPPSTEAATPAADAGPSVSFMHFAAVFDGHGGSAVANHCTEQLPSILRNNLLRRLRTTQGLPPTSSTDSLPPAISDPVPQPMDLGSDLLVGEDASCSDFEPSVAGLSTEDVELCLINSFEECDAAIPKGVGVEAGTTAVCTLLNQDTIWVANCGDSRAVICRRGTVAVPLTNDHKPERPDEQDRVRAAGGHVFWNGGHRVMGVLSMSRALGDHYLRQYGVISTPEVTCVNRTPDDEFLLLASDGLWGILSNSEAVGVASACLERAQARGADRQTALRVAAQVLVKAALQQGSSDNITVILIDLKRVSPHVVEEAQITTPAAVATARAKSVPAPPCASSLASASCSSLDHHKSIPTSTQQPVTVQLPTPTADLTASKVAAADGCISRGHDEGIAALPRSDLVLTRTLSGKRHSDAGAVQTDEDYETGATSPTKRTRLSMAATATAAVTRRPPSLFMPVAPCLSVETERLLVAVSPNSDSLESPPNTVVTSPW